MKNKHIRVAEEFKQFIDRIRAKELLFNSKELSCEEVTRRILKYLDWEKVWQNEFNKK